jgi:polyhydroxybutyrate depolymerase
MNAAAADRGVHTLTPVGTPAQNDTMGPWGWNALGCCDACFRPEVDDLAFALAMLDWAEANLCVDTTRVYAVGFSNGGFFANTLACRLAPRLAGVATMAGSLGVEYMAECTAQAPLPFISFHSLTDPYVPYAGNVEWASQPAVDRLYRERAGCTNSSTPEETYRSNTTRCETYHCPHAPVAACVVDLMNHCWIGGRSGGFLKPGDCLPRPGDVDATDWLMDFWGLTRFQ